MRPMSSSAPTPVSVQSAPTAARQPPPSVWRKARSAVICARVARSLICLQIANASSSSARHSTARAPCAGAGRHSPGSSR